MLPIGNGLAVTLFKRQSVSHTAWFTPIQLANYAATIANGGTRYKVNLIKSVRSSVDGGVVKEFNPEVVGKSRYGR